MDSRAVADATHALLARAATARSDGDGAACVAHLTEAVQLLSQSDLRELLGKVCWRLAKAGYDFEQHDVMLDALAPVLGSDDPFAHAPGSRRALPAIATRWWDARGYADDRLNRLWGAWARVHEAEGDPWMAASGRAQQAWHRACAGDHAGLDELVEQYLALDPKRFGNGPHRHPDAPDTPSSVWWAQLELLRIALWSTVWSDRRERALDLLDALEDAAEAAELHRASEAWFLDPACRAAIAFDLHDVRDRYAEAWIASLSRLDHPRAPFHLALARGLVAASRGDRSTALPHLEDAVRLADEGRFGAEWSMDARRELAKILAADEPERAARLRSEGSDLGARFGIPWSAGGM